MGAFLLAQRLDGTLVTGWPGRLGDPWPPASCRDESCLPAIAGALEAWFDGACDDPAPASGDWLTSTPPFYRRCWDACREIEHGQSIDYATLARRAGSPRAIRAAGTAMRMNPAPILVPCHRVLARNGLGGFAGQVQPGSPALVLKKELLDFESTPTEPVLQVQCPAPVQGTTSCT